MWQENEAIDAKIIRRRNIVKDRITIQMYFLVESSDFDHNIT